jgi:hypothetical protein
VIGSDARYAAADEPHRLIENLQESCCRWPGKPMYSRKFVDTHIITRPTTPPFCGIMGDQLGLERRLGKHPLLHFQTGSGLCEEVRSQMANANLARTPLFAGLRQTVSE